ncbi:MAG: hypothetical protein R3324_21120, partial [Halobacteriales archaeon]|nr:hypothetical protein [Halobacteriales archaeon]
RARAPPPHASAWRAYSRNRLAGIRWPSEANDGSPTEMSMVGPLHASGYNSTSGPERGERPILVVSN